MPNHVHLLIGLNLDFRRTNPVSLAQVVGTLKSRTTVRYIRGVKTGYLPPFLGRLWQLGYYETVMRNEKMAEEYRYYISNNPAAWEDDLEMSFVPEPLVKGSEAEQDWSQ
jgi:REP element-mobilizing transposase RayT